MNIRHHGCAISKGKDVQVKILNNEYYLDLYDKKK